eukprot:2015473-Rhodomonas_salina.1
MPVKRKAKAIQQPRVVAKVEQKPAANAGNALGAGSAGDAGNAGSIGYDPRANVSRASWFGAPFAAVGAGLWNMVGGGHAAMAPHPGPKGNAIPALPPYPVAAPYRPAPAAAPHHPAPLSPAQQRDQEAQHYKMMIAAEADRQLRAAERRKDELEQEIDADVGLSHIDADEQRSYPRRALALRPGNVSSCIAAWECGALARASDARHPVRRALPDILRVLPEPVRGGAVQEAPRHPARDHVPVLPHSAQDQLQALHQQADNPPRPPHLCPARGCGPRLRSARAPHPRSRASLLTCRPPAPP